MSQVDYGLAYKKNNQGIDVIAVKKRKPERTENSRKEVFVDEVAVTSNYAPNETERKILGKIRRWFVDADTVMRTPRREFNDMSVLSRLMVDQMAFNVYQPNNGDSYAGDKINGWRSSAMRPVERNKAISVTAHVTARTIFPKVFAWDNESREQEDAAIVMRDLMDYAMDNLNYPFFSLKATLTATWSPACIGYTEYCENYREIETEDGKVKMVLDETFSGFNAEIVPVDQLYIADFYEADIQKQPYLIRRRVKFFDVIEEQYRDCPNFKYVRPGVQTIYSDANNQFYDVYDTLMRQNMVEELTVYYRAKNRRYTILNGVLVKNERNPRIDGKYPFFKFGFELLDEGNCFYYKSLVFKMAQDAKIINTLYPMIIDGTYLSLMPPLLNTTGETMPSNVMIPGASVTLQNKGVGDIRPLEVSKNISIGFNTLQMVQESIADSAPQMEFTKARETAYVQSLRKQELETKLGLFTAMVMDYVKQFGTLVISDILQYMTIANSTEITGDAKLIFKTFFIPERKSRGRASNKRIKFDYNLTSEEASEDNELKLSYATLKEQGGDDANTELIRVNPTMYRDLKFKCMVSPDVMTPLTEEMERAFKLEIYDRAIQNPLSNQEEVLKNFLFGAYPETNNDPDKYIQKQNQELQMEDSLNIPKLNQNNETGGEDNISSPLKVLGGLENKNALRV